MGNPLSKWFHRHIWQVISATQDKQPLGNYGLLDDEGHLWARPVTRFISQCTQCGKLKEQEFDGNFQTYTKLSQQDTRSTKKPSKGKQKNATNHHRKDEHGG